MAFNKVNTTVKINDFEPTNMTFTVLKDTEDGKNNSIGWANYKQKNGNDKTSKLALQLDWKYFHTYGVPKVGEFYPTDQKRAHLKYPVTEHEITYTKFDTLDNYMKSDKMLQTLFPGKKIEKYEYVPCLKKPEDDSETRPPYIKIRLHTTWPDITIKSEVFLTKTETVNDIKKIMGTPEKMEVTTLDDFTTYVKYKSTVRPIIEVSKIWADTKPKSGGTKLKYGIVWRLVKILVDDNGLCDNMDTTNADFIDDDDDNMPVALNVLSLNNKNTSDDEEEAMQPAMQSSKQPAKQPAMQPAMQLSKQQSKKVDSDDEEELQQSNKVNEDEDDEETEPQAKQQTKKLDKTPLTKTKQQVKKVDSDEEEELQQSKNVDSEDEVVQNKPKPKPKVVEKSKKTKSVNM